MLNQHHKAQPKDTKQGTPQGSRATAAALSGEVRVPGTLATFVCFKEPGQAVLSRHTVDSRTLQTNELGILVQTMLPGCCQMLMSQVAESE